MSLPATESYSKLNPGKLIPDIVLILLYFFCVDPLIQWQQQHLSLSCSILMMLNIAAVGIGCFTFFILYADDALLRRYENSLSSFEGAVIGLSAFICSVAFFWWLVPFASVKKMGVQETGFILGACAYFVIFMTVVSTSIGYKKGIAFAKSGILKAVNYVITVSFFFFSYAFLMMTLQHWQPGFIAAPYLAIICLVTFYLPLRFFLLLRPPFHKLEYVGFILSFGILLIRLFISL